MSDEHETTTTTAMPASEDDDGPIMTETVSEQAAEESSSESQAAAKHKTPFAETPDKNHFAPPENNKPVLKPVDNRTRSDTHSKLRAYEARRRLAYTAKLESSSLYWRSFRDLLHASVHETARAERLVLGSAIANQTYADAMQATYEDVYLDDKGNIVTDARKQKKLLEQRHGSALENNNNILVSAPHPAELSEERRTGMLSSLIESHAVTAERFTENAKHVQTEIYTELTGLRKGLQTQVQDIERLGDAIVHEIEAAATEVENAWEAYYDMAMKSMGGAANSTTSDRRRRASDNNHGGEGGTSSSASPTQENCTDVWVVEMQYRVAVAYQSMAWEKGSAELSKLFTFMKEAECHRRVKLREILIAFLNRQERLFSSLPSIQTPVLKDLVSRMMDRDTILESVQSSIRKRAQALQRQDAKNTTTTTNDKSKNNAAAAGGGSGLTAVDQGDGEFTLESPLMSQLLCKAKVIERKTAGMMKSWKTTLAVVTSDSFLHLFDLPPTNVQCGTAPEVAFHSLVPTVQVPTSESIKAGKYYFVKGWSEHLTPAESLVLPNCTITAGLGADNSSFEITETIVNTGSRKMFGKTTTRKLTLRTVTREEAIDWIDALKAQT